MCGGRREHTWEDGFGGHSRISGLYSGRGCAKRSRLSKECLEDTLLFPSFSLPFLLFKNFFQKENYYIHNPAISILVLEKNNVTTVRINL